VREARVAPRRAGGTRSMKCLAGATMRRFAFSKLKFTHVLMLGLAALAAWIFFFGETSFSRSQLSWQSRFERELETNGEVSLGALVSFEWDKIYLLQTYDLLNTEQERYLFPVPDWSYRFSFWWEHSSPFWTIAYQRPGRSPFLVRMRMGNWYLRNETNLATTDPNAKLKLVPRDTIEATYCVRPRSRCLALVDSQSPTPTEPYPR
jgi:hypothetical protein